MPLKPKDILTDPERRAKIRVYLLRSVPVLTTLVSTFEEERFPPGGAPLPADVQVTTTGDAVVLKATVNVPVGPMPPDDLKGVYIAYAGEDYRESLAYYRLVTPVAIKGDTESVQVVFTLMGV